MVALFLILALPDKNSIDLDQINLTIFHKLSGISF